MRLDKWFLVYLAHHHEVLGRVILSGMKRGPPSLPIELGDTAAVSLHQPRRGSMFNTTSTLRLHIIYVECGPGTGISRGTHWGVEAEMILLNGSLRLWHI